MDIITRQEKKLLLGSSICEEDIELKEFLSSFPKNRGIKDSIIENLQTQNRRIYLLLKSDDARKAIIDTSSDEWVIEQHVGEKLFPCELCGSTKSKDKYSIRNKKTKFQYEIGNSCMKHFPKEMSFKNGNNIFEMKNWTKEQIFKSAEFFDTYKTGKIIFNKWTKKYNDLELLMPLEFDNKFSEILKMGKKFYKDFINDTLPKNQTIRTFEYIKIDFDTFYKDCIRYGNDNKDDMYICNKNMVDGLEKKVILEIKKSYICKINRYRAKYITNTDFINKFVYAIKGMFENINLELKDISNEGVKIEYSYKNNIQIVFSIPLQRFTNNYSEIYFSNSFSTTLNKVLKDCILTNTFENIDRFLKILKSILEREKYYFTYTEKLHDRKIIEVNKADDYRYAIINYNVMLNKYIEVLDLNNEDAKKFLLEKMTGLNWISNKEKEKYDIGDISKINTRTVGKDDEKQYNQYESEEEYYQRINRSKKKKLTIEI